MEKPGNSFATVKMWKKHPKEKFTLEQVSVPASANQPPGFSIRGSSTPNGLFQTIKY